MRRQRAMGCLALLLAACGDPPVSPDEERASLAVQRSLTSPSNFTAAAKSTDQIDLAWRDNSSGEDGFEVHRSTEGSTGQFTLATPGRTGTNAASYSDLGRTPGTGYCYKVRAFKVEGKQTSNSGFSSVACATTPALPAAPSNANVAPAGSNLVMITWKDNSANEYGFRIERSPTASGPWVVAAFQLADSWFYVDQGRASEQQVCYRLIAYNGLGESSASNTDCTVPPAGPTNLVANSPDDQSIDLSWTENSTVEDGYQLQRAAGSQSEAFSALADLPTNSASYRDIALSPNTVYRYRVLAKKDGGSSDISNTANAGTCFPSGTEEICDNGTDDDCDGLIDRDPECATCDWDLCPSGFICDPEGFCVSHCSDGGPNGDESDVDCGGSCYTKCDAGQHCNGSFDCASNSCVNSVCQ